MSVCVDKILEVPPVEIESELDILGRELDSEVPMKSVDQNLLVATWNLRSFGDLTEKWVVSKMRAHPILHACILC